MDTLSFIALLENKSREEQIVAVRQALAYFLYKRKTPVNVISQCLKMTKRNVYFSIYKTRDKLEIGDRLIKQAYNEIKTHNISVSSMNKFGKENTQHIQHKLIIDNIITQ